VPDGPGVMTGRASPGLVGSAGRAVLPGPGAGLGDEAPDEGQGDVADLAPAAVDGEPVPAAGIWTVSVTPALRVCCL
jgi:hypothetical protein